MKFILSALSDPKSSSNSETGFELKSRGKASQFFLFSQRIHSLPLNPEPWPFRWTFHLKILHQTQVLLSWDRLIPTGSRPFSSQPLFPFLPSHLFFHTFRPRSINQSFKPAIPSLNLKSLPLVEETVGDFEMGPPSLSPISFVIQ